MKQTKKPGFALWAACVLLCLVLISAHFTTGLYAKFVTNASGSDRARAGKFQVSASMSGEDSSYELKLRNGSETEVMYSISVQPAEQDMFASASLDNSITGVKDAKTGAFVFSDIGTLRPGTDGNANLVLTVNPEYVDPDAVSALLDFSNDSVTSAESELPFTVTVTFVQVN